MGDRERLGIEDGKTRIGSVLQERAKERALLQHQPREIGAVARGGFEGGAKAGLAENIRRCHAKLGQGPCRAFGIENRR